MSLLELKNISKSFGDNVVLDRISLSLEQGEIHAIIGENGAGKSTLMKIIGGIYAQDGGQVLIDNREVQMRTPMDAYREGIGIVHQELSLAENMTVAQNVFVNHEPTNFLGFIDWKQLNHNTVQEFKKIGIAISPETIVKSLSVGMQQIVEIVKVLSQNVRILILDEPTSALSDKEIRNLFDLLSMLRDRGTLIIFISHKLREILEISDRVSVLRDGKFIGTLDKAAMEESKIIKMMVGREIDNLYPPKADVHKNKVILETKKLTRNRKFYDVDFKAYKGEVTGIFGLIGSGRTEFAYSLFGADRIDSGTLIYEGSEVTFSSPAKAIEAGIGYLSEDRKRLGLFIGMDVKDNIVAATLEKISAHLGLLNERNAAAISNEYIENLDIHPRGCNSEKTFNLSGGNQQKVLLSKWLAARPHLLIVDEPTRGVDIGAKANIHKILRDLANTGIAIVMISSDLPEILGLSDKVVVFHEGRITDTLANESLTEEMILEKAFNKGGVE